MSTNITGREVILGVKKATTWRTAVQCGALDGLLVTNGFSSNKSPIYLPDDSLGQDDIRDFYKSSEAVSDSLEGYLRYEGWDTLLALVMGTAGTPTQNESTAYYNTYSPAANINDYFATMAIKKSPNTEGVWEIPSAKITGFTISARVGELAKIAVQFMGNKIETDEGAGVNGHLTIGDVTYPDRGNIALMNSDFKMRMNTQGGGALADSDKIYPYGFSLTYSRPMKENFVASYHDMSEPSQEGFSVASLDINFDKYNLDTFMAAVEDQTDYKLDITFQGGLITGTSYYTFRLDIPKITWVNAGAPLNGPGTIPHNVSGMCQGVASAPTGMSGVTDPISIYAMNTRTTDPLA